MLWVRVFLALVALVGLTLVLIGGDVLYALPTAYVCWVAWALLIVGPTWWRWYERSRNGAGRESRPDQRHVAVSGATVPPVSVPPGAAARGDAGTSWGFEGLDDD